eukprot:281644_1
MSVVSVFGVWLLTLLSVSSINLDRLAGLVKMDKTVNLNVYFEACCSDCQNFITGTFKGAYYYKDWTNMTNITLIPGGKCSDTYNSGTNQYDFSCQHGPTECSGNIYMACAVKLLYSLNPLKYTPFIISFMQAVVKAEGGTQNIGHCPSVNMVEIAQSVCNGLGNDCDWNTLSQCHDGSQGNQIYHQFVSQTHQQAPDLNWVPWIELNMQHSQDEQNSCENNVLQCTCKEYHNEGGNQAQCCS